MYNVKIETIRENSTQRIAARDLDHAIAIATSRACDKDATYIATYRNHRLISVTLDKRTQFTQWC